ncbi:YodC family protein [Mesorhizobium sp. ESP7-2]|uniref:YodC family protein n=1 Tax=Mesorhizobium sp. ESP7-2 TaxID=2876622 RepID=UPI001CD022FE|nr:DUF2158 domain-containing protein [Mesorhizobium sp. ESP7-2]MBZ9709820.1 YodC family protein [Mesorhizobium sp. ESP7-2]
MSDASFIAGQTVQLLSGGPLMTVEQVGELAMTGEPAVWCVWFEKTKKFNDTFRPETLKAVERSSTTSTFLHRA